MNANNSFIREGKIVKYEWIIEGENEVFVGRQIRRIFRKPGEYEIRLTIENDLGQRSMIKKIITVTSLVKNQVINLITNPQKNNDKKIIGKSPLKVNFDISKSILSNIVDYEWDFDGDGIGDEFGKKNVSYVYENPGEYLAKIIITDDSGNKTEKIQIIEIEKAGIEPVIKAIPPSGTVPLEVTFDASRSKTDKGEIVNYIWKFPGKEPIPYGGVISYEFKNVGTYEVFLTVETSDKKQKTISKKIVVRAPLVRAIFKKQMIENLVVRFSGLESTGMISDYKWFFGDNETGIGPVVEHEYKRAGTYRVRLKIVDKRGIISQIEKEIEVKNIGGN